MSGQVLPDGWREARLGDVVDLRFGFAFNSSDYRTFGSVRLLRGDNIAQGATRWEGAKWLRVDPNVGDYGLQEGDVALAMDRPWIAAGLKFAVVREADLPALLVQRVARIRGTRALLNELVPYVIGSRAFSTYVQSVQTGSAVPHISGGQIGNFVTLLPPVRDQRAIAEVLGALDDKIAANNQVAAASRALSLTVASRAKAAARVDTVAEHRRRQINPATMLEGRVDHYSLPAFDAGSGPEAVAPTEIKSGKFVVTSPSVLVSKLNPRFPRIWDVPALGEWPALASTEFVVLEPREISTSLLWALLAQPSVGIELEAQVSGTSGSHQRVRPEAILSARIGDPASISEGDRATIEGCVSRAHAVLEENLRLAATRDALLPALMSGRLTVSDAERVVADAT